MALLTLRMCSQQQQRRAFRFASYELTLMCHGESEDVVANTFAGWQNTDLTTLGIDQAKRAGRVMHADGVHYHFAYTSELARALSTARHVLQPLIVETKVLATWRLNDRHYGDLTGETRAQMARVHGERRLAHWLTSFTAMPPIINVANPAYTTIQEMAARCQMRAACVPRTESAQMVFNRVRPFWQDVIVPSLKMRNRIIIIAHGESLRALIKAFADIDGDELMRITLPPAVPITFTLDNHLQIIKPVSKNVAPQMAPAAAAVSNDPMQKAVS